MVIPRYTIGSATADALSRLGALQQRADFDAYRIADLTNMAAFCAQEAHGHLADDPAKARDFLIHTASRALAAAERIDADRAVASAPVASIAA